MRKVSAAGVFALVLVVVATAAPSVSAEKPTLTRIEVDETTPDRFLTRECGVDVMTHIEGHVIIKEFDRDKGTVELRTLNLQLTAIAGDNTYSFHDVGADHVKITKEGAILSIVGQIPFDFIGVVKINLDTGEVVHEPSHDISGRLADACAALTA